MKLFSWNVNGIRSVHEKGFLKWFTAQHAEVVCLQEVKADEDQLAEELRHPRGYHSYWYPAEKRGYSGVAIYTRREPLQIRRGLGHAQTDSEGRVLIADFREYTIVNAYFPNSRRDHSRLPYKLEFCQRMKAFLDSERRQGKNIILCGDHNIAHKEIDLKNPKTNVKNAGFLPEERAWMDSFTSAGYIDVFREFEPGPNHYTWWSYRPGVRQKNIGWRLDYFFTHEDFRDRLKAAHHQPTVVGSDHCPVWLELRE